MEAMGSGIPAVITDTGGGKEVLEDGVAGYVVPVGDAAAIAARIKHPVADPALLTRMSKQCINKISNDFFMLAFCSTVCSLF